MCQRKNVNLKKVDEDNECCVSMSVFYVAHVECRRGRDARCSSGVGWDSITREKATVCLGSPDWPERDGMVKHDSIRDFGLDVNFVIEMVRAKK